MSLGAMAMAKKSWALEYFETPHGLDASHLCAMHGIKYDSASNPEELEQRLEGLYTPGDAPRLLEVFTPTDLNDKVLKEYFDFLKQA